MGIGNIFGVFFLTICIEIITAVVWSASQYPLWARALLMPVVMLVLAVGITDNYLKRCSMSYADAGIRLPRKEQWGGLILYSVAVAGLLLLCIKPYCKLLLYISPGFDRLAFSNDIQVQILGIKNIPVAARQSLLIYVLLLMAAAEELLFRGFVLHYLAKRVSFGWALFWSAFVFSLVHLNPLAVILTLPLGLLLGWLMRRTGNITAPIAAHCIYNVALLYMYKH
ncbi:MAG TPA: hypothetical protein DCL44_08320 [Elusimicrobia bacterium]|nr:hypothetical protein [Elusimicrobiota bacterium]